MALFGLFEPYEPIWTLWKTVIHHFLCFMMSTFMEKNLKKKQWSADLALQDGWKKKQSQIQDTSSVVGVGLVFTPYRLWWYIHVRHGWNYLYKQELQSVEKHQLGTKAIKMAATWKKLYSIATKQFGKQIPRVPRIYL